MTEDTTEIRHAANLPFGYQATFIWSKAGGTKVEWNPAVPRITAARAFRKFREAYDAARRSFNQDVATSIGGSILIVDLDGQLEVVKPAQKH